MDELIHFFFDSSRFVPRSACGDWNKTMRLIYALANFWIFGAYLAIPATLILVKQFYEELLKSNWMRWSFANFILWCGLGHLIENCLSFVWPQYHFFTIIHCLTAISSWACIAVCIAIWIRHAFTD